MSVFLMLFFFRNVHYLIATDSEVQVQTKKVVRAQQLKVPILSEDFFRKSLAAGKLLDYRSFIIKSPDE